MKQSEYIMFYVRLLYLFLPVVLAGICNMIFVKIRVLDILKRPMDKGCMWKDGRRIFGDNKTWKGFIGMILFTSIWLGIFAFVYDRSEFFRNLSLLDFKSLNPWFWGAVWGFGYVIAELPNSFIKRRLGVGAGKNVSGFRGQLHTFFDQCDSVIGCLLTLLLFYSPEFEEVVFLFFLGTAIHYVTNLLLYFAGLKKQRG